MPTPSIPSNDEHGNWNPDDMTSQASSEVIKSILIDVPAAGRETDGLAVLRTQFQSEVQAILARLQAVETHLGMPAPPTDRNNLYHEEDTPSTVKKTWVQMPHDETIDDDVLTQTSRLEEKSTPVRFEESSLVCNMRVLTDCTQKIFQPYSKDATQVCVRDRRRERERERVLILQASAVNLCPMFSFHVPRSAWRVHCAGGLNCPLLLRESDRKRGREREREGEIQ